MTDSVQHFYNDLADHYHRVYESWQGSIDRQAAALADLIQSNCRVSSPEILDCSCGIGTQVLGLAKLGYRVQGSDLSPKAIQRAKVESVNRGLDIPFKVADFRTLDSTMGRTFDVVLTCDNSLPHLLTEADLDQALARIGTVLEPGGLFIASIRDYDALLVEKPDSTTPQVTGRDDDETIVFQVWEWADDGRTYSIRLFVMQRESDSWRTDEFVTQYRAIRRDELTLALERSGFADITWLSPEQSGFFQPVVVACRCV
ncbi:MAG: glycine/sarcosine N-methyltransferase [Candidatus Latescibacterota bacterium]|jgi:glycine/sarcosine N-methyltransferase